MKVGEIQILTVARVSDYGLYLADEEQNEVLLPNRYVSLMQKVGDTVSVFVYHDSEDRLVATTETPKIKAGEVVESPSSAVKEMRQRFVYAQSQSARRNSRRQELYGVYVRGQHNGSVRGNQQTQNLRQ